MILRPSASSRWSKCSLSEHLLRSPRTLPETDTDAAREGTCAAWVAECVINGDATHCDDLIGKTHENGWFVDQEMADHIQPYVEMAQSRSGAQAEVSVSFGPVTGTLDLKSYSPGTLHVDDLKYGYGIVEPTTFQLKCYLAGVAQGESLPERIVLGIYQPRAQHRDGIYRTITLTRDEAYQVVEEVRAAASAAVAGGSATAGPHCLNCLRAHDCEALAHAVYDMWEPVQKNGLLQPNAADVSQELTFLNRLSDILEARHAAVRADAEERIKSGQFVPGWALQDRHGKRKFTLDRDSIRTLTGFDPVEEKMITPAALERMGADKKVVKAMTTTPRIGRKLEPVTEKDIAKMFK